MDEVYLIKSSLMSAIMETVEEAGCVERLWGEIKSLDIDGLKEFYGGLSDETQLKYLEFAKKRNILGLIE